MFSTKDHKYSRLTKSVITGVSVNSLIAGNISLLFAPLFLTSAAEDDDEGPCTTYKKLKMLRAKLYYAEKI